MTQRTPRTIAWALWGVALVQVIARRVHCLPDEMWRRMSSGSSECLT